MTADIPHDGRRPPLETARRAVIALVGGALLVAALGSCGSSDSGAASGTTKAPGSDLVTKLPKAAAIGNGYRLEASSYTKPPEPFDPATSTTTTARSFNTLDKYCPGSRWPTLDAHPDVAGVEYAQFIGDDDREVTVGLAPLPTSIDEAGMTKLMDAINECGTITDRHSFAVNTTTMHAEPETHVGDYGIDIRSTSEMALDGADVSGSAAGAMGPLSERTYLFVVDDVLVSVVASNGFDLDHLHTVTPDDDLVPHVAAAVTERLTG